jgi:hypothetical protein
MMRLIGFAAAMAAFLMTGAANAGCIGSGSFQTCNDASGNSYTVNRFGNTTTMNGYNSQTGSTWSQNSNTVGNTTFHNGTSSDGNSWNLTDQRIGSSRNIFGTDSRGNTVNRFCGPYGCN